MLIYVYFYVTRAYLSELILINSAFFFGGGGVRYKLFIFSIKLFKTYKNWFLINCIKNHLHAPRSIKIAKSIG